MNLYRFLTRSELKVAMRSISMSNALREEALESLKTNPYFDKYSKKLLEKQKMTPDEFYTRLEDHAKQNKTKIARNTKNDTNEKTFEPGQAKIDTGTHPSKKTLEKVMKLELIENKTREEIQQIWEEFHKSKECTLSATIPVDTYQRIQSKAKEHPVFLLPLPRNQGYEFIVLQFAGNEIHFTPLISYQTHQENAPECLTIVYYPELIERKNIVLMKGEYDNKVINAMEAQCLANQLQLFYGEDDEKRTNLMRRFTRTPDEFKHMDLIAEIECLSF